MSIPPVKRRKPSTPPPPEAHPKGHDILAALQARVDETARTIQANLQGSQPNPPRPLPPVIPQPLRPLKPQYATLYIMPIPIWFQGQWQRLGYIMPINHTDIKQPSIDKQGPTQLKSGPVF
ncbi:MAG: hypothetical protein RL235_218 [Chlamydiota bacterium]